MVGPLWSGGLAAATGATASGTCRRLGAARDANLHNGEGELITVPRLSWPRARSVHTVMRTGWARLQARLGACKKLLKGHHVVRAARHARPPRAYAPRRKHPAPRPEAAAPPPPPTHGHLLQASLYRAHRQARMRMGSPVASNSVTWSGNERAARR